MFVFLHGLIGNASHFDPIIAELPQEATILAPKLPYNEEDFADIGCAVAHRIRATAHPGRPVVVVGNSIGCVLALDLAELADHVVLTGPPFDFGAGQVSLKRGGLEPFVRSLFSPDLDPTVVDAHLADAVAQLDHLTGCRAMVRKTRMLRDIAQGFPCHPGLSCQQTRVTLLVGALDFMAPIGPLLAHLSRVAPHARLRVVPNCGHAVPVEAPQAVVDVLHMGLEAPPGSFGAELGCERISTL